MTAHNFPIRIYYEDTDAGGVVYHASYVRFAERARTELLRDLGYNHMQLLREHKTGFVVRHMEIDFQRPALLDDSLNIATTVTRMGGASFDMQQTITRDSDIIADIKVVLVCMNVETMSAVRVPDMIRNSLQETYEKEGK